jgi:glycosyltransferase involved in cell wall biosynthesis
MWDLSDDQRGLLKSDGNGTGLSRLSLTASHSPRLTVGIPTWNSGATIQDCLKGLCNQTCKDFETIIVDAGSTDATKPLVSEFAVSVIDSGGYRLLGQRLIGAKTARASRYLLLDADQVLATDTVERIVATPEDVEMTFLGERSLNPRRLLSKLADIDRQLAQLDFENQHVPTQGMLHPRVFRTSLFVEAANRLPEWLLTMPNNWADVILYAEAYKISHRISLLPNAIYHEDRDSWLNFMKHYYLYGKNLRRIERSEEYRKLIDSRIASRFVLPRRQFRLDQRIGSTLYMFLKGVPHTLGYWSEKP